MKNSTIVTVALIVISFAVTIVLSQAADVTAQITDVNMTGGNMTGGNMTAMGSNASSMEANITGSNANDTGMGAPHASNMTPKRFLLLTELPPVRRKQPLNNPQFSFFLPVFPSQFTSYDTKVSPPSTKIVVPVM